MIDDFAIESFRILRRRREFLDVSKNRAHVPVGYVNWVARKLEITWWFVVLYGLNGRLAVARSGGNPEGRPKFARTFTRSELFQSIQAHSCPEHILIIEMEDSKRQRQKLSRSYGFLVVMKSSGFLSREVETLREIAHLLGDYIIFRDQLFRLRRIAQAFVDLDRVSSSPGPFGTKLSHVTYELGKALGAGYGGYVIVKDRHLLTEFLYRQDGNRGKHAVSRSLLGFDLQAVLDQEDAEALGRAKPFMVHGNIRESGIIRCIVEFSVPDNFAREFVLLVTPILFDGQLIGAYLYGISRFTLSFEEHEIMQLLEHAQKLFVPESIYVFQRRINKLVVSPVFRGRETRIEPNLVFVLMPFGESWSDRIWGRLIRPVCDSFGMKAIRADDLYGRDIMEDIWSGVCRARIVIADITARNPNVFYELGIAHTLGKEVILLTQSIDDIPFDLNRFRHIVYADNMDGYDTLKRDLGGTIEDILRREGGG